MIDSTFRNINRLFVLSFTNGGNDPIRDSLKKYYMPLAKIKHYNVLTINHFLINLSKTNKKHMKNLLQCQKMMDDATRNSSDFQYDQKYHKFTGIDLSRQTNTSIFQQMNFTRKLEEGQGVIMFLLLKSDKNCSKH